MLIHDPLSILMVTTDTKDLLDPFCSFLQSMDHIRLTRRDRLPDDLSLYQVITTPGPCDHVTEYELLSQYVHGGGGWLCLIRGSTASLPPILGAQLTPAQPVTELRVSFPHGDHAIARRMPHSFYLDGPYQGLLPDDDETEVILGADWQYRHVPVLVSKKAVKGRVACTTLQSYNNRLFQQVLYRLMRIMAQGGELRASSKRNIGIGILGYAQSVGQLHGLGARNTEDLELAAVCDLDAQRRQQASLDFPGIRVYNRADDMGRDPDVDLVIVATAPNTHAALSLQMMSCGKHVVCEKPLALNRTETDAMVEMSRQQRVHLSCHQNRRFDVDYRAIRQAVVDGLIGDLFYMETFVGGFSHPCGYWHSHEQISGGTAYDWGGHYLDWIISLITAPVKSVSATRQKRVWHDVTNADQERIHLLFSGGEEAQFIHSDIAAARKPKWYVLGTKGAIVSTWRDVTHYGIDPVVYFHQQEIPATEMPPELNAYRRHDSGEIIRQTLPVPRREHFLFHRNLADHLLTGETLQAPLNDSVMVVSILEAARESSARGCAVEIISG